MALAVPNINHSELVNLFTSLTASAAEEMSATRGTLISPRDIRRALVEVCGIADEPDLLPLGLSLQEVLSRLHEFDFASRIPVALVSLEESILPAGVPGRMDEAEAKHKNEIWRVHKNDADPFPSNPHAHNVETGYKLHLGNGDLYSKTKKVGSVSWKHLLAIREKLTTVSLPPLASRHG